MVKVKSFVTFVLSIKFYTVRHRNILWTLLVTRHKMVGFSKRLPHRLWLEVYKPESLHNFLPVTTAPQASLKHLWELTGIIPKIVFKHYWFRHLLFSWLNPSAQQSALVLISHTLPETNLLMCEGLAAHPQGRVAIRADHIPKTHFWHGTPTHHLSRLSP